MSRWIDLRDILPSSGEYTRRNVEDIDTVVIHHSDTGSNVRPEAIAEYHLGRGWPKIGYHFLIGPRGETWWANDLEAISYHVGEHNGHSLGVCLIGSFMEGREPTDAQIEATRDLVAELRNRLSISQVVGHRELTPTDCPGETFLNRWKAKILEEARRMTTKLGVQIQHWVNPLRMIQWFEIAQPPVAKSIDDEPIHVRACKAVSPDTIWIGRAFTRDQDMSNPYRVALRHRDRILRKAMVRDVDAWELWNEVTGGHGWNDETKRFLEAESIAIDLLHAEGLKVVAGSWSVGCPSDLAVWTWEPMLEVVRKADFLGLHEYLSPTMWDIRGFDPPYFDREEYIETGWFTLRYRFVHGILEEVLDSVPPIIITETGVDSGAAHWPLTAQGGWRSFTDPAGYMEQMAWYDRQLCMDAYVAGATIFTFGTRDPTWSTFDTWEPEPMRIALRQYLATSWAGEKSFEERLAEAAQEHVIAFNPEAYFRKVAGQEGWLEAISPEFDYEGHRAQVYIAQVSTDRWVQKIIYSPIGQWHEFKVIEWEN